MNDSGSIDGLLAEFARDISSEGTTEETVDVITASVVKHMGPAEAAGVTLLGKRGKITTLGATTDWVAEADRLQVEVGEGPCLDALAVCDVVLVVDLAADPRWEAWSPRAVDACGVRSMLSAQLVVQDRHVGALNLYSRVPGAFSGQDVAEIELWATHASVAVASAQKVDQLESAVVSRTVIGQAQGIVMERYGLDDAAAFEVLKRLSQHSNVRLAEVAAEIVRTRRVPE